MSLRGALQLYPETLSPKLPAVERSQRRHDRVGLGALAIYLILSLAIIGRPVLGDLHRWYVGRTTDPSVYMWMLCWWPYALAHRLNPLLTHMVWAPNGFDLAWTTSMPLVALLGAPLTAVWGPVAAYNVLCIVAPVLAAWCCFLLCRWITDRYMPAAVGGCIFGFSAYMLAEARGHLALLWIFPVPLAVLVTLIRLEGRIRRSSYALLMAAVLTGAFLLWAELYASLTMFGLIALVLTGALGDQSLRVRLRNLIVPLAAAYVISLSVVVPYLYYFLRPGYPHSSINSPAAYSADLLGFLIPTAVQALGTFAPAGHLAPRVGGNLLEAGAYVGLPLIGLGVWLAIEQWGERTTRLLAGFAAVVVVLMLGPKLHVGGRELFGMPWKVAMHLPLLRQALPVRFAIFLFLDLAIITSLWFSASRRRPAKIVMLVLLAVFLCPNPSADFWRHRVATPAFFTGGGYRRYLKPADNVLILPYGISGPSMLWQASAGFYFRMAGGWTSVTPREFERWPIVNAMLTSTYIPEASLQLRAFMAAHRVAAVIVDQRQASFWAPMLAQLDPSPVTSGGVVIYRPSSRPAGIDQLSADEMAQQNNAARFSALLSGAQLYLERGSNPARLTPMQLERRGLLPPHWVNDPDVRTGNGLYLGPWPGDQIAIGVVGSYDTLRPLIAHYRADAARVLFPFPRPLRESPRGQRFMRLLVMVFDRPGLARAAAHAGPTCPGCVNRQRPKSVSRIIEGTRLSLYPGEAAEHFLRGSEGEPGDSVITARVWRARNP